jgi:hypothetical protein
MDASDFGMALLGFALKGEDVPDYFSADAPAASVVSIFLLFG